MLDADTQERRPWLAPLLWGSGIAAAAAAGAVVARLPLSEAGPLFVLAALVVAGAVSTAGNHRVLIALGATVYVVMLHWAYVDWVAPIYGYSGLTTSSPGWPALTVITIISVMPVIWLPVALHRPSEVMLWVLYLFGYVPASAIPIHLLGPDLQAALPLSVLLAIAFASLALAQRIPLLRFGWNGLTEPSFDRLLVVLGLGVIAYLVAIFGIPTNIPGFDTVYDVRSLYAVVENNSPFVGYLVPWAGNVIYPFLMALGLSRHRRSLLILGIVGQLLIYSITGLKMVFFAILVVPILYVLIRYGRRRFGTLMVWGAVASLGLSVAATAVSNSTWPLALFVTRILAIPGQLTAYYYDFFSSHATYELSRSFLSSFIEARYDVDPPYLIGAIYLDAQISANANLWADAMAQFGVLAVIPFTLVLAAVAWILDSLAAGRDLRVLGPTMGLAGISLANGALFTSILTFGIGLIIGLVILMPRVQTGDARAP